MKAVVSALVLGAALVAGGLVVDQASSPGGTPRIVVDDTRVTPNRIDARVGQALTVELVNRGTVRHDLEIPSLHMPGLQGFEVGAEPGQTVSFTLEFDTAGIHEFECPEPGDAGAMTGAIFVSP